MKFSFDGYGINDAETGERIATFTGQYLAGKPTKAQVIGPLLAAAPQMLATLQSAENWLGELAGQYTPDDGLVGLLADIRAAITKADGR